MPDLELRPPRTADWLRTVSILATACGAIVGLGYWLGQPFPALFAAAATTILVLLVRRHAATTGYRCPDCGRQFMISAWEDFLSPHMLTTKYVKCPACKRRSWMEALIRE
jgi:DNA-directed RNA polymerase subunit RPC12/RpoP